MSPRARSSIAWKPLAILLLVAAALSFWCAQKRIQATRHDVIQRRLSSAAEVMIIPARDVLAAGGSSQAFLERLRELGSLTGLRITLIAQDGTTLADSEVRGPMPNLRDRPEVAQAIRAGEASASRTSVMTGKETVYLARSVMADGVVLGTIRAATEKAEIDDVASGLESVLLLLAITGIGLGAVLGAAAMRSRMVHAAAFDLGSATRQRRERDAA